VLGRLGDTRGERPVFLGILVVVTLGTVLTLVADSLPLLLLGRVLQGTSYGLFPLSISVLRRELPAGRLSVAMSLVSSTLAVGGVIGLVATGLVTRGDGSYRDAFWIGLAVCLVSLVLAAVVLPRRPATASGGVDWWGAALLGAGLVLLLLPVSQGNAGGWTALPTLGCAVAAVVVLAGWVLLQRRLREPLVRPSMLTDPRTLAPNIAGLMTGLGLFISFIAVLQYVQAPPGVAGYGFGASVLEAAVVYLLPGGVIGIVLAPIAGRVVARLGALPTLLAGGLAGVAGFLLLALLRGTTAGVVAGSLLAQAWVTVAYAALPALVVQAVRPGETGVANAVNSITRSVGQAAGSALAVALLTAGTDPATGLPRPSAFTLVSLIGVAAAAVVVLVAVLALAVGGRRPAGVDPLADVEQATAGSGEWSPVSGLR
jgi:predicted MFS family arabinose efflux permease